MEFKTASNGSSLPAITEFDAERRRVKVLGVADVGFLRVEAPPGPSSFTADSNPAEVVPARDRTPYLPGSWTAGLERLTDREMQIALMVSHGKVNKQIAQALQISAHTVSTHLRNMFFKLGVHTRAELVFRCAENLRG